MGLIRDLIERRMAEMAKGDEKPTGFVTVGHGEEAKHVPIFGGKKSESGKIVGGRLGGDPPLHVMERIHENVKDPEKKKAWAERIEKHKASQEPDDSTPDPGPHVYGSHYRPVGFASAPSGATEYGNHPEFRGGTATYAEPLSEEQRKNFQLVKIPTDRERRNLIKEMGNHEYGREALADYDDGDKDTLKYLIDSSIEKSGLHVPLYQRHEMHDAVIKQLRQKHAPETLKPEPSPEIKNLKSIVQRKHNPDALISKEEWKEKASQLREVSRKYDAERRELEYELADLAPKKYARESIEERVRIASEKKANAPLVAKLDEIKEKQRAAGDAEHAHGWAHDERLAGHLLAGEHVPTHFDQMYRKVKHARRISDAQMEKEARSKELRANITPENAKALYDDVYDEVLNSSHDVSPYKAANVAASRVWKAYENAAMPYWESQSYGSDNHPVTPEQKRIGEWVSKEGRDIISSIAGHRGLNGYDELSQKPLSDPRMPNVRLRDQVAKAVSDERFEEELRRKALPIPDTAWHLNEDEVGEDKPHGHGFLYSMEEGKRVATPYFQTRQGTHSVGTQFFPGEGRMDAEQEYKHLYGAAPFAIGGYSGAKRDIDTLDPWNARLAEVGRKKDIAADYANRLKDKQRADEDQGWKQSPHEYAVLNEARIREKRGLDRTKGYAEARRHHKYLVESAHNAGYEVPETSIEPGTYYTEGGKDDLSVHSMRIKDAQEHQISEKRKMLEEALDTLAKSKKSRNVEFNRTIRSGDTPTLATSGKSFGGKFAWNKNEGEHKPYNVTHLDSGFSAGQFRTEAEAKRAAATFDAVAHLENQPDSQKPGKLHGTDAYIHAAPLAHWDGRNHDPLEPMHPDVRAALEPMLRKNGYDPESVKMRPVPRPVSNEWTMQRINQHRVQGKPVPEEAYTLAGGKHLYE